jgi:hypothetical protein
MCKSGILADTKVPKINDERNDQQRREGVKYIIPHPFGVSICQTNAYRAAAQAQETINGYSCAND